MKKIIMFVMVLAIATPAMALIWEPHTQGFSGCPGSGQVIWEFTEPGCMPTSDVADPPYYFDPEIPDPVFGTSYTDGGPVEGWTWSGGVYTVNGEDGLNQPIPDRVGKQYMRMYFEVVHTIVESSDPSFIGFAMELWNRYDWSGCPTGAALMGEYNGNYFPPPTDTFDLGGGWHQSYWVFDFSTDGSVGIESPILHEATHTTALIGMSDFGAEGFEIDEVHITMVWHDFTEEEELVWLEDCICLGSPPPPPEPPIEIYSYFRVLYEPNDPETMGPMPPGPTSGNVEVRLHWQPEEPDDVQVIIDPNPDSEVAPNPDIILPASTEPNGVIRLIFNQSNWDVWQNVVYEAVKDLEKEGNENHIARFSTETSGDPNFDGYSVNRGNLVIDNDIPYILAEPYNIYVSENDPCTEVCFNVRLSHLPTDDVRILVAKEGWAAQGGMFEITPPLGTTDEPNCLTFTVNPGQTWDPCTMTSGFNENQTICVNAVDNDELFEAWEDIIDGEIILTGQSKDEWYNDTGFGGELEAEEVDVDVQDNECGAWGYMHTDVNEDCYVDLGDVALFYGQWLTCTLPYDGGYNQWGDCDALWNLLEEE
ncbi:MAG: hypothetical protein ACYSWP_14740 [Planctomycetota bacterium]